MIVHLCCCPILFCCWRKIFAVLALPLLILLCCDKFLCSHTHCCNQHQLSPPFHNNVKTMSLSYYKQSEKGYNFLAEIVVDSGKFNIANFHALVHTMINFSLTQATNKHRNQQTTSQVRKVEKSEVSRMKNRERFGDLSRCEGDMYQARRRARITDAKRFRKWGKLRVANICHSLNWEWMDVECDERLKCHFHITIHYFDWKPWNDKRWFYFIFVLFHVSWLTVDVHRQRS